jgi:branched-chain amino acid transport system ATP-binding protein
MLKVDAIDAGYGAVQVLRGLTSLRRAPGRGAVPDGPQRRGQVHALKAVMGLVPVRAGSITLDGEAISACPRTRCRAGASATCRRAGASSPN